MRFVSGPAASATATGVPNARRPSLVRSCGPRKGRVIPAKVLEDQPLDIRPRPSGSSVAVDATSWPPRRDHGQDRAPPGNEISLRASFKTRRVSQARRYDARWLGSQNVRGWIGRCRREGVRRTLLRRSSSFPLYRFAGRRNRDGRPESLHPPVNGGRAEGYRHEA
jgi:hypothetical protein